MRPVSDSYLSGTNVNFIEALYERYLKDRSSVDPSWVAMFDEVERTGTPLVLDGQVFNGETVRARPARPSQVVDSATATQLSLQRRVNETVVAFRLRGHLQATLDPLGAPRPPPEHVDDLGFVSDSRFTPAELDTLVDPFHTFPEPLVSVRRILERLRRTYCGSIGVEYAHLYNSERRNWLHERMEFTENTTAFSVEEKRRMLKDLTDAEVFENTIHTKFQGQKRFSTEGGETQLAMLHEFLDTGTALGLEEVVFGMAHRGRLSILCNICGKPPEEIFSELAGPSDPKKYLNRGDVKYHMGFSKDWESAGGKVVHVTMAFNPSHLGFVYPVVEGRVRAKQDRRGGSYEARSKVAPLLIHGDAAFVGQGLTAETLNMEGLRAYDTGGTIHLVVNNQIGYTTLPSQGRSSVYCTAPAQIVDIPIFHVNGDDVEAAVHVARIATEYRQRFHSDVVIDLVCYRRYGHNEGDEPAFTQPQMYDVIRSHPTPRAVYAKRLAESGVISETESNAMKQKSTDYFAAALSQAKAASLVKDPSHNQGLWSAYKGGAEDSVPDVVTGVPLTELKPLLTKLAEVPEGFVLHPNLMKGVIAKRQAMVRGEEKLDWGAGECLAYATLIAEGVRIRVTGQDSERGTFAHRHAVLHDQKTGRTAFPLSEVGPGVALITNSPLSEMGCLGFEYGYALDAPEALVAWEAQFGDFANNAQVIIDQFIASGEDKWMRLNGITLLLPHGYEGAGPEHSSARLERFLQLAAEDNMQICVPSTAAQIFHLLRRQVLRKLRKPLIVMTPKSLLRLADAASPWEDFTTGTYQRLKVDPHADGKAVSRLLLCSGKVYFDLRRALDTSKDATTTIARLEQLYPLPMKELEKLWGSLPGLQEVLWVQEEPKNSGAWAFVHEHISASLASRGLKISYVGRPESASPATGFLATHQYEQRLLVEEATNRGK